LLNPKDSAVAETQPEKTEVTLPPGVAVNPSAANGIVACALVQFKAETAESPPGQGCPHASSVGTLVARTPLLEEAIEGSVYLAAPHDNPFNSLLALYVIARAPERGVLVKQAGEVHADPVTGQLTTTFDHLPPLPYSSFQLNLREGPRAPLVTPQTCGTYLTEAKLYSFSNPGIAVERSAPFEIASGAIGGACASSEAQLPNKPSLEAGTLYPIAGAYSPLLFKLSREDGSQRLASIAATLPAGLTGKLAGIPYCPETSIAAAAAKSQEGEGARELSSPSCPPASQVATVNVSAGAGPEPYPTQGKAYLAGPYKGAPLSLAIITPAIAGPFDLGVVVVRTALNVDPVSAQINAVSDPLPTVLHGIPLDIRSVSLQMNRRDFTLNPTSCEAKSITGQATSALGQVATLSNRFQVGACGALAFKPALKIELKGQTKRGGYPKLRAVLKVQAGAANIAAASVALPHSEFLAQEHIETICTRVQFAAGAGNGSQCPPRSVYGRAKAFSPLLDQPLSGPVYLRSSSHSLPDLVAALHGQIEIVLDGRVDSVNGGIRNSFRAVPDAPVSKFVLEMQGGKKGLLVNSTDICKGTHRAVAVFGGQNGKRFGAEPALRAGCSKRRKD
jgi:hypothetical protein